MKKIFVGVILTLLILSATTSAQETYFGKNKVRYKDFEWNYIQSRHFDIHFYDDSYELAKFTATVMESSYVEISRELNYTLQNQRIPVFVYDSHNDFQQTNIVSSLLPEGVGGFTEVFKTRVVIPFDGSYEDFRHVLHHELTHAIIYDLLFGKSLSAVLSRQRFFNLPLWFAEGYAEYSSRHGWDYFSDMYVRDATINNYLAPPMYLGGFLAYKQGQAMIKYIAEKYGEDKLGLLIKKGKVYLTMNKALKEVLGKTEEEFWKDFSKEMKKRYWPEIALREEPEDFAHKLTKAREDGSYFNEKPEFHPDGSKIAMFTDKSDYTELVLISAKTGKILKSLVKSSRSGDLESLHSYVSGISFNSDGSKIVFVAKSDGKPTLMFYDTDKGSIYQKKTIDLYQIVSPSWSPDDKMVAFAGLNGTMRDLYVYNIETDKVVRITSDVYDDNEPTWTNDSKNLIFSSDRPHPQTIIPDASQNIYVDNGAFMPGEFAYGYYNLFQMNLASDQLVPLDVGPGQNKSPKVSPDGTKLAFISSRNGIDNIYVSYLENDNKKTYAVTDILTGINHLSWSPDGKQIAFSAFNKGVFDIFVLEELVPKGESGVLALTAFQKGEYDLLKTKTNKSELAQENKPDSSELIENLLADEYVTYDPDSVAIEMADTAGVAQDSVGQTDAEPQKTGIYDEGYVFVSETKDDKFDGILADVPEGDEIGDNSQPMSEPEFFDSIPGPDNLGDYEVKEYKPKFTTDYFAGGPTYDTFFGLRGGAQFVFSDYLGNHQLYVLTDLVNTIDQSNVQVFYFYNRHRTNYGIGMFHTKNYYEDNYNNIFSDRFYGLQGSISRPFSTFSRVEFLLSQYFIDRSYVPDYYGNPPFPKRSSKVTTADLSYVTDNIVWGYTGPINGRRTKISVSGGVNLFDSRDISFYSVDFDFRRYWHIKGSYSLALRVSGGSSFGNTPKLYFLGGTTNWIGNRTLDAKVYEVENLYFADVVTPLRGVPYYELSGDRYGLINAEFRYPLIDYFVLRFPLQMVLSQVKGVLFADMGSSWFGDNFKGGTSEGGNNRLNDIKFGFGAGMRLNLGIFLLRYDLAWKTDFSSIDPHTTSYFSFGADF